MKKYIIIDIDGTICEEDPTRSLEEFEKLDHANLLPLQENIEKIYSNFEFRNRNLEVIFLTARDQEHYFSTYKWLKRNFIPYIDFNFHLIMRPLGDLTSSHELKIKILKGMKIEPEKVEIWIDDSKDNIHYGKLHWYNVIHPKQLR